MHDREKHSMWQEVKSEEDDTQSRVKVPVRRVTSTHLFLSPAATPHHPQFARSTGCQAWITAMSYQHRHWQRVVNAAARIVCDFTISPLVAKKAKDWIQTRHLAINGLPPSYVQESITPASTIVVMISPAVIYQNIGKRSFSVAVPCTWNENEKFMHVQFAGQIFLLDC